MCDIFPARPDPALPEDLRRALATALREKPARVRRVSGGGQVVWLKQVEKLSLRWRLQKGDARRAFEADLMALRDLSALDLPVPQILAEGRDYFVTADAGPPIAHLLLDPAQSATALRPALLAAGAALGALHARGVVHGRPKLRDICWDGRHARLIDFELYRRGEARRSRMAQDMLVLLHSLFTLRPEGRAEAGAALEGWLSATGPEFGADLLERAQDLAWLRHLSKLVLRLRPASKETRAMVITLDWITKTLR